MTYEPSSKGLFAPTSQQGLAFRTRRRVVAKAGTRSAEARAKTEAQKASLAEHVAEGGAITAWARNNGIDDSWTWQLWAKIKRDLGAQAV